jgi:hypothetical protein
MTELVKFPSTSHLAWLSPALLREDKVLSHAEATTLLGTEVTVEEKVDGANLGFGAGGNGELVVQNRGTILGQNSHPQFAPLWSWLAARQASFQAELGSRLVLFGEWCFARHSSYYDRLPHWFLAFDVYDRQELAFWSVARRSGSASVSICIRFPRLHTGACRYKTSFVFSNGSPRSARNEWRACTCARMTVRNFATAPSSFDPSSSSRSERTGRDANRR